MADENKKPDTNSNSIMQCLGRIEGRLNELSNHSSRQTFALIGVIAAQIGVKVLGTDPLLDVATVVGIVGCFLILGFLVAGIRMIRSKKFKMTQSGVWLLITMLFVFSTQVAVYFRDLGSLDARIIYVIRIFQNASIVMLGWNLMKNANIVKNNDFNDRDNGCH